MAEVARPRQPKWPAVAGKDVAAKASRPIAAAAATCFRTAPSRTTSALASATGLIRSEVGKQTGLKHTP